MSEESKKIEKIEKEAKQDVKEVKPTELSEQELDNVAGGSLDAKHKDWSSQPV